MSLFYKRIYLKLILTTFAFITINQLQIKNHSIQSNNHLVHASEIITSTVDNNIDPKIIAAIKSLLLESLEAAEAEDIEAGMATMHPDSAFLTELKNMTEQIMAIYDFDYEYDNFEIMEILGDEAKVKITQTTRKIGGEAEFRDNRTVVIQTLKKHNGEWKFFNLPEIINIEYL